jgi:hypothetical protein
MCHCGANGEFDIVFGTGTISREKCSNVALKKKKKNYVTLGMAYTTGMNQKEMNYVTLGMAYITEMNQRKKKKEQAYQNAVQSSVFI